MSRPASTDSARRPSSAAKRTAARGPGIGIIQKWLISVVALTALAGGAGPASAQARDLVATIERTTPGAVVRSPGYVDYTLKVANTHFTDPAENVQLVHRFGPNALYDVTVSCTEHGSASCPVAASINIADGKNAGRIEIMIPSLPTGGGVGPSDAHLEFSVRGVTRGYPLGTITHYVDAVDADGDQSMQQVITDTLNVQVGANVVISAVEKSFESPVGGRLAWGNPYSYRLVFRNDGNSPMPLPNFADSHRNRSGEPLEEYVSSGVITNSSTVVSCDVVGTKPGDAPDRPQGCPYSAGESWAPGPALRHVLPRRDWNQVLYPGQQVEIVVEETIHSPGCLAPGVGDVDEQGRLALANRAYFNVNTSGPQRFYPNDQGSQISHLGLPMEPLPDCSIANLKFELEATPLDANPSDKEWGEPVRWQLSVDNVSDLDFGDVPVALKNTLSSLVSGDTSAQVNYVIESCTPRGGARCPWPSLPTNGRFHVGGPGVHKVIFDTPGATIPQGGGMDVVVRIAAVNPANACRSLHLRNNQWQVSVENPPDEPIQDSDGNTYDAWDIVGNEGGSNDSVLVPDPRTPALRAIGQARVNYTGDGQDCDDDGLKQGDPAVTQQVAQPPVVGGGVAFDVTVTNVGGFPGISDVTLTDDLSEAGIDLGPDWIDDFSVSCQSVTNGASCPTGAAAGTTICEGAACPLTGSTLQFSLETLPASASMTIRIAGAFPSGSGEFFNYAAIEAGPDADYEDVRLDNNFTRLSTGAPQLPGTLVLGKVVAASDGGYVAGDTFDFSVSCEGYSPIEATFAAGEAKELQLPPDVECTIEETGLPDAAPGYFWEAPSFAPSNLVNISSGDSTTVEITNSTTAIDVGLQKSVQGSNEVSEGLYEIIYTVTVTNNSTAPTTYSLDDIFRPDADVQLEDGYPRVEYSAGEGLDTTLDFPRIVSDEPIGPDGTDTFQVTVRYRNAAPDNPEDNACTGEPNHGLFNRARMTLAGGNVETAQACLDNPYMAPPVIRKELTSQVGGASDEFAEAGEELTYRLTISNAGTGPLEEVDVIDVIPEHTTFVSSTVTPQSISDSDVRWTVDVPAEGETTIDVTFQVAETIPAGVQSIANDATANGETCAVVPCTSIPTGEPTLAISKSLTGEAGSQDDMAEPGEALTYTIMVTNTGSVGAADVSVVDATPAHTTPSLPPGSDGTVNDDGTVEWTLDVPAGETVVRTIVFTVDEAIPPNVETIDNNATVDGMPCSDIPCVSTPVGRPELAISKALIAEDGMLAGAAEPGEQLTYLITVSNSGDAAATDVLVVDVTPEYTTPELPGGSDGVVNGDGDVQWSLDVGAGASASRTVTFVVDGRLPAGLEEIANNATANDVPCAEVPCVSTPVAPPQLEVRKELSDENGRVPGQVEPGERLTYTITVENVGGVGVDGVEVVDDLPPGTAFASADNGGALEGDRVTWNVDLGAGEQIELTLVLDTDDQLPAGQEALVNNATANGEACAELPCVQTPLVSPPVAVDDSSEGHLVGDQAVVAVLENDRAGSADLDPAGVWIEGAVEAGASLTVAGEGEWSVDPQTGAVLFNPEVGFTDDPKPIRYSVVDVVGMRSNLATITLDYLQDTVLRLSKEASARTAVIGDLLRYTLTIENVGASNVNGAVLMDVPPLGFVVLPESVRVADGDGAGRLASISPLRVEGIDVAAGEVATVSYFMVIGATTLPGAHTNEAVMQMAGVAGSSSTSAPTAMAIDTRGAISNVASATVLLTSDPLFDQALILGTVFDDRDGDGWQDSADATDLVIRGLDLPGHVPGSLTVDHGDGPQSLPDEASGDGVRLGRLPGRSTIAEDEDASRIVVSHSLKDATSIGEVSLSTAEGFGAHIAPDGTIRVDHDGKVAKGLNGQDIRLRRRVSPAGRGVRVDYVISNAGVQEQGIPGVRLATVEGLVIETDAYGRFHLEGVETDHYARGSNFILKLDEATLPPGSTLTTENPRIRRITPGMPVRFDFGVRMSGELIEGGSDTDVVDLGEVLFEAGSAQIREEQWPAINRMVGELAVRGGGKVEMTGLGGDPELAYARAVAVSEALATQLDDATRENTTVTVRGEVDSPEVISLGTRLVIGEVFFDTDDARIKSEYAGVISRIAEDIQAGRAPTVILTGHADRRASDSYNLELGRRRADAVHAAIAAQLSPSWRERLQVEYLPPTNRPSDVGRTDGHEEAN